MMFWFLIPLIGLIPFLWGTSDLPGSEGFRRDTERGAADARQRAIEDGRFDDLTGIAWQRRRGRSVFWHPMCRLGLRCRVGPLAIEAKVGVLRGLIEGNDGEA